MITAKQIIEEAKKWLGVVQGTSRHKQIIDGYNSISPKPRGYTMKYSDHWCATFITFIFDRVGASELIGRECGVESHINIWKAMGIWIEDGTITPKPGDIITYNWDQNSQPNDGWADHVGIVTAVSNGTITVIEGNIDMRVDYRKIRVGHGQIRGYARPKYKAAAQPVTPKPETKKSIAELAKEIIAGKWGVGQDRKDRLTKAGYNYDAVQAEVNRQLAPEQQKLKSIDVVADEVIRGLWGNGSERKKRLEAAGYNYTQVQNRVNSLLGVSGGTKKTNDQIADEVIRGLWGNGQDRINRLKKAGYDPDAIQKIVNANLG